MTRQNNATADEDEALEERIARPCIGVTLIRHGESRNNAVYGEARDLFGGGTPDFDEAGYKAYVEEHRQADPGLSATGAQQAELLARYLIPHWQSSAREGEEPHVSLIVSPMRRACETLRPTLLACCAAAPTPTGTTVTSSSTSTSTTTPSKPPCPIADVTIHGLYFETEGCHKNNIPEEGMNPDQLSRLLYSKRTGEDAVAETTTTTAATTTTPTTVPPLPTHSCGFRDPSRGWWCDGTGHETRSAAEQRAATFYLWLCEFLNHQLTLAYETNDTGTPNQHGIANSNRRPKRQLQKQVVLVGHGDFMSMVLQRIVSGFGHAVETSGVPHRSAFVHSNTALTELAYFGHGRFLILQQNALPHLVHHPDLHTGGTLRDGWSYMMPTDAIVRKLSQVSMAGVHDELGDHVHEQREALKALYRCSGSGSSNSGEIGNEKTCLSVLDYDESVQHFVVQRGLQVVGVATYSEVTGQLYDVAVRPSAGTDGTDALFNAIKEHSKKIGRSGSLVVLPTTAESKQLFAAVGFGDVDNDVSAQMEFRMD